MKSKRRHELHENMLAGELRKAWEFIQQRGGQLATGALVIAVLIFAYVYYTRYSESKTFGVQGDWDRALTGQVKSEERASLLETLAAQTGDRRIAALACVELGYDYATKALLAKTGSERAALEESAGKWYQKTIADFSDQKLALAKAQFGLGKLYESQRKLKEAAEQYGLAKASPELVGQPVVILAESSLQRLTMLASPVVMVTTMPASAPAPTSAPASAPAAKAPASAPAPTSAPAPAPTSAPAAPAPTSAPGKA
jgi:hypothetical protein